MYRPVVALLVALLLAALAPERARGEEEEGAGGAPPAAEEADQEAPLDPRAFLGRLRDDIEALSERPPRSEHERALRDAWRAILAPRRDRMIRRLERLIASDRRWLLDEDGVVLGLAPDAWPSVVGEMATLYTTLGGALEQYEGFRVRYVPRADAPAGPPSDLGVRVALARLRAAEAELARRIRHGELIGHDLLFARWAFARDVELAIREHAARQRAWEEALEATEDLRQRIHGGLQATQDRLRMAMLSVRAIVGALQAVEAARLADRLVALPLDEGLRARADEALAALHAAQRKGEEHRDRPAAYGSVLRGDWLRARRAVLAVLEEAEAAARAGTATGEEGG